MNSCLLKMKKAKENVQRETFYRSLSFDISSEIVSHFSPGFWAIRPSDSFVLRKEAVLRGDDNVWTPVLRSFNKLREVGVSSYLFYS